MLRRVLRWFHNVCVRMLGWLAESGSDTRNTVADGVGMVWHTAEAGKKAACKSIMEEKGIAVMDQTQ